MRNAGASGHAMICIRRREASHSLTERLHSWHRPGVPQKKGGDILTSRFRFQDTKGDSVAVEIGTFLCGSVTKRDCFKC